MPLSNQLSAYIKRRAMRIRGEYSRLWKNYIYQSLLASTVVFLIMLALSVQHAVIVASLGASAFIVFTMPKSITARPRRFVGGHFIGLLVGSLFALIPHSSVLMQALVYALAVGVSMWAMVTLDCEHPPAAGTALGVALTGFSPSILGAILTLCLILSVAYHFSKRFLRDLT